MTRKEIKLLLTAFDPFGGEKINPAWEAVKEIPASVSNSAGIACLGD